MRNKVDYKPERCECCGQTTTYALAIDKGTVRILKKVAKAIEQKGINCIHLAKEKVLTHSELCNIIRPRFHGLVAHVEGNKMQGNFCLTNKALDFLKGARIPRVAIVSKVKSCQIGYFQPVSQTCVIDDFKGSGEEWWVGIGFDIVGGRVVKPSEYPNQPTLI